jgi:predicted alpha/beta-hydrolase family hydrolase
MAVSGVVLFPGAGSSRDHSSLVRLEEVLYPLPVARVDFPYRRAGKKAPDRAPVLMQCVREEVQRCASEWGTDPSQLVIGGRSMGGRMCSMVVAHEDDPVEVAGLLLVSYPLHPPGKPEKLRVEHLPRVAVPTMWISGTRDTFGTPDELQAAVALVQGESKFLQERSEVHFLEKKGHDLKGCDDNIAYLVQSWLQLLS